MGGNVNDLSFSLVPVWLFRIDWVDTGVSQWLGRLVIPLAAIKPLRFCADTVLYVPGPEACKPLRHDSWDQGNSSALRCRRRGNVSKAKGRASNLSRATSTNLRSHFPRATNVVKCLTYAQDDAVQISSSRGVFHTQALLNNSSCNFTIGKSPGKRKLHFLRLTTILEVIMMCFKTLKKLWSQGRRLPIFEV